MAGRISAATERALARVKAGETPYAAARAEGIATNTIYRALGKQNRPDYAGSVGYVLALISARLGSEISIETVNRISLRPDLIRTELRHLDLSGFTIPEKPAGWTPGEPSASFWLGYYRGLKSVRSEPQD